MDLVSSYNIYIPDYIISLKKWVQFHGFMKVQEKSVNIYIYAFHEDKMKMSDDRQNQEEYQIEGFCFQKEAADNLCNIPKNFLVLQNIENYPKIMLLKVNDKVIPITENINIILLLYNYDTLLKSEGFKAQNNSYSLLSEKIKLQDKKSSLPSSCPKASVFNVLTNPFIALCKLSTLCSQIKIFFEYLSWIYNDVKKHKKVSVKSGNMILALLVDSMLGIVLLNWINQWCQNPSNDFMNVIEMIVNNLRILLQWLMGSPAGLKLNHAFNNTLGKFFLYHIELWWMFIVVAKSMFDLPLSVFKYIGVFGVTFQSAILADFLTIASLHVYCIYVYAARLYNMQVTGLIALWRLFLGKKKNPLRGGVDTCQYTHQQLFVGMLTFTILLFLLPTTALYYIVFTLFRICMVVTSGLLTRIRYIVSSLPLYVLMLWVIGSPKIASNIQLTILKSEKAPEVVLGVTFSSSPLRQLVDYYRPEPIVKPPKTPWFTLISNLWLGELIYPV